MPKTNLNLRTQKLKLIRNTFRKNNKIKRHNVVPLVEYSLSEELKSIWLKYFYQREVQNQPNEKDKLEGFIF